MKRKIDYIIMAIAFILLFAIFTFFSVVFGRPAIPIMVGIISNLITSALTVITLYAIYRLFDYKYLNRKFKNNFDSEDYEMTKEKINKAIKYQEGNGTLKKLECGILIFDGREKEFLENYDKVKYAEEEGVVRLSRRLSVIKIMYEFLNGNFDMKESEEYKAMERYKSKNVYWKTAMQIICDYTTEGYTDTINHSIYIERENRNDFFRFFVCYMKYQAYIKLNFQNDAKGCISRLEKYATNDYLKNIYTRVKQEFQSKGNQN